MSEEKHIKSETGEVLKYAEGKPSYSVLPYDALEQVIKVFEYGAGKYGRPFTYRAGIPFSRLFESAMRHLVYWYYWHEDYDPETNCYHLAHAAANCLMLLTYLDKAKMDDRPEEI